MSLILDALKKSEAERQRQVGPTLLEVRVTKPQRRFPLWAVAVGALLLINMMLLLVFVLRRPAAVTAPVAAVPAVPAAAAGTAAVTTVAAPPTLPAPSPIAPMAPVQQAVQAPVAQSLDSSPTLAGSSVDTDSNPADNLPAVARPPEGIKSSPDDSSDYSNLPSFSELAGSMPDFRLDLHVYSESARNRYALVNMQRVHEGDTLSEGARVLAITREGVALDYRGQRFMLRPRQ
jgi:general secretion pathway protein B